MKHLTQQQRLERQRQRDTGYALYMAGQPESLCANDDQRHGFMTALRQDADCQTYGYLRTHGELVVAR